jgi:hypothetical protein
MRNRNLNLGIVNELVLHDHVAGDMYLVLFIINAMRPD